MVSPAFDNVILTMNRNFGARDTTIQSNTFSLFSDYQRTTRSHGFTEISKAFLHVYPRPSQGPAVFPAICFSKSLLPPERGQSQLSYFILHFWGYNSNSHYFCLEFCLLWQEEHLYSKKHLLCLCFWSSFTIFKAPLNKYFSEGTSSNFYLDLVTPCKGRFTFYFRLMNTTEMITTWINR